jgi:hypothetical protein
MWKGGEMKKAGALALMVLLIFVVPAKFPKTRGNVRRLGVKAPATLLVEEFTTKGGA